MFAAMFRVKPKQQGVWTGPGGGLDRIWARLACAPALATLGLVPAACSSPEEMAASTGVSAPTATAAPVPPAPPSPAPGKVDFTDNAQQGEAKRDFAYRWPAAVSAIPALADRLAADRDKQLAEQKTDWEGALKEFAGEDCPGCVNRAFEKEWAVVADLPRFLSLSYTLYVYSGGAHGNSASGALVWDREAKAALESEDLFVSPGALQSTLSARWCAALRRERTERLSMDPGDDTTFPCPPIADLTLLVGSSNGKTFDRIGLIADPYVAGSYAEGSYEVTFPVTGDLLAAVKPEYKAAFARGT